MFLRENQLLDGLNRIRHLPAVIVQGRYDMICPTVTADELARAWPEARYEIVPDAGHSALEPGIRAALVAATEGMRGHLAMETTWDARRMARNPTEESQGPRTTQSPTRVSPPQTERTT